MSVVAVATASALLVSSCSAQTSDSVAGNPHGTTNSAAPRAGVSAANFDINTDQYTAPEGGWLTPYIPAELESLIADFAPDAIKKLSEKIGKLVPGVAGLVVEGALNLLFLGLFGSPPAEGAKNAEYFRQIDAKIDQIQASVETITVVSNRNFKLVNATIDQLNINEAERGAFIDVNTRIQNAMKSAVATAAAGTAYATAQAAKDKAGMAAAKQDLDINIDAYKTQAQAIDSATVTNYMKTLLGDNSQGVWQLQNQRMRTLYPIQSYELSLVLQRQWAAHMVNVAYLLDMFVANQAAKSAVLGNSASTRRTKVIANMKSMYPQAVPPGTLYDTATGMWLTATEPTKWAPFNKELPYTIAPRDLSAGVDCRTSTTAMCELQDGYKMFLRPGLTADKTYMGVSDSTAVAVGALQKEFPGIEMKELEKAGAASKWQAMYTSAFADNAKNVADGIRAQTYVTDKDTATNKLLDKFKNAGIVTSVYGTFSGNRPYYYQSTSHGGLCPPEINNFCDKTTPTSYWRADWAKQTFNALLPSSAQIAACPSEWQYNSTNTSSATTQRKYTVPASYGGNLSTGPACTKASMINSYEPNSDWTTPLAFGVVLEAKRSDGSNASEKINPVAPAHFNFSMPKPRS